MAISEDIFDGLSKISGYICSSIYLADGELVSFRAPKNFDAQFMGGLAIELYKSAKAISENLKLGIPNFVEVHTEDKVFIHTCIVPGVAALGLVMEWAKVHQDELIKDWDLAKEKKKLLKIAPLQ